MNDCTPVRQLQISALRARSVYPCQGIHNCEVPLQPALK